MRGSSPCSPANHSQLTCLFRASVNPVMNVFCTLITPSSSSFLLFFFTWIWILVHIKKLVCLCVYWPLMPFWWGVPEYSLGWKRHEFFSNNKVGCYYEFVFLFMLEIFRVSLGRDVSPRAIDKTNQHNRTEGARKGKCRQKERKTRHYLFTAKVLNDVEFHLFHSTFCCNFNATVQNH